MSHRRLDELDPEARALIDAARDMHEPSPSQRARTRRALHAALGGSAVVALHASSVLAMPVTWIAGALVVGATVTGGVWVARGRAAAQRPPTPVVSAPPVQTPSPPERLAARTEPVSAPVTPELAEPTPAPGPSATRPSRAAAPVRSAGPTDPAKNLVAETALLEQVSSAIYAGAGARALTLIGEYDRRYGSTGGALLEERSAEEVLALCLTDHAEEAKAKARAFVSAWPHSPLVRRIHASCAGRATNR
jgi:hypothetical protein